jgi:hypothetical protein
MTRIHRDSTGAPAARESISRAHVRSVREHPGGGGGVRENLGGGGGEGGGGGGGMGGAGPVNSYAQMPPQQQQRDRETERAQRERDLAPRLVQV